MNLRLALVGKLGLGTRMRGFSVGTEEGASSEAEAFVTYAAATLWLSDTAVLVSGLLSSVSHSGLIVECPPPTVPNLCLYLLP